MSKDLFKRASVAITATATILSLAGYALPALGAVPADFGLTEGDVISANGDPNQPGYDPDVYIVNDWGYKRLFLNPVIFSFYGHLGGFVAVKKVSPATRDAFGTSGLFRNCETNDPKVYGLEVTAEDTGVLHWVNTSGAQAVLDDPNFFLKVFCINNNEFNWYPKGSDYTSVNQIPPYSRGGATPTSSPTPVPGGGLSASLSSDNPAAGTVVAGQALADLAHFRITNSSGSSVLVTKVNLRRLGISGDTTLDKVYLFSGNTRLTDSASVASGVIAFNDPNGILTVGANSSSDIRVRSDILTGTGGQTVGVQLTQVNSTMVSVQGNIFNIASTPSDLATVAMGVTTTPATGNIDPAADVLLWQNTVSVGNKDVWLNRLTLREIGTINYTDIRNLRLFVDGVQVAVSAGLDANGYVHLIPVAPHKVLTGSRILKVLGDVIGGTNRNFSFSLRGAYDLDVVDSNYNVNVRATGTFPATSGTITVNPGTVTVVKATNSPSGNVVLLSNDTVLARFTLTAYGENVKVETFVVEASRSDTNIGSLRNGRVYINGTQFGSTQTLSMTGSTSFTVNYTAVPGTPSTVEVRADIFDNDGTDNTSDGDRVQVRLHGDANSNNAQAQSSLVVLDVPSADVAGNTLTLRAGTMTLAKNNSYANQTVTVPKSNLKLGAFVLSGNANEDVNVNTFTLDLTGADQWTVARLTDVYLRYGPVGGTKTNTAIKSTVIAVGNTYSVSFVLPKTQTYDVEVFGNVSNFTAAGANDTMTSSLTVSGTTAQSSQSVSSGPISGQTLTAATGSITSALSSNTPNSKIVADLTTEDAAVFKFTTLNDSFTVTELQVKLSSASGGVAASVSQAAVLKRTSTGAVLQTQPFVKSSGNFFATFSGLAELIAANSEGELTVALQLGTVGPNAASTGANAFVTLNYFKANDSAGVETTNNGDLVGNNIWVHKSYPKIDRVALDSTVLADGNNDLAKFKFNAIGDPVAWKEATFSITKPSTVAFGSVSGQFKLFDGDSASAVNNDITANGNFGTPIGCGLGFTSCTVIFTFTSEREVASVKWYRLQAVAATGTATGNSVVANWTRPSGTSPSAPNTYAIQTADANNTLVWSDRSAVSHSELTADWMDDGLVNDLPMSWTLSR